MNRVFVSALLFCAVVLLVARPATAVVAIDTVPVGNPGNPADTRYDATGFGSVRDNYVIGTTEVTNGQYAEFLNGVDPTGSNTRGLYNSSMTSGARGGIVFNTGAANGSKYSVKSGRDNNPVVFVSWYDSIRFTNWLHNGQGAGDTENGAYTLLGGTPTPSNGNSITRNAGAKWWLPSEDEWYKAAYHKNDGATGNYWDYPTSTDAVPYSDQPPGSGAPDPSNTANFLKNDSIANGYDDGFAVTGSSSFNDSQNYLTDVGAYTSSDSPYGTFDQGGNVWEWNEALISGSVRGYRGGTWSFGGPDLMRASHRNADNPSSEWDYLGLRVASIPEPDNIGDYNRDGTVDAADYVVWRKNDGSPDGYNLWRANFGNISGSGSAFRIAVPEPAVSSLLSIVAICSMLLRWPRLRAPACTRRGGLHGCRQTRDREMSS